MRWLVVALLLTAACVRPKPDYWCKRMVSGWHCQKRFCARCEPFYSKCNGSDCFVMEEKDGQGRR